MTERPRSFTGDDARRLLRLARTGTIATINREDGIPYASLANVATDVEGQPLILISNLAWHTRNLTADSRASMMVADMPVSGDALMGARVTVMGRFELAAEPRIRRRYLARHPAAVSYAGFADFAFWRLRPETIHAVAGFGRIETFDANEVFPSAREIIEIEENAIVHMNSDHSGEVRRYATRLLGAEEDDWKILGIDPDGADLSNGNTVLRLAFPEPLRDADALRRGFAALSRITSY